MKAAKPQEYYESIKQKFAEEWWVQEVIEHRGKTTRNQDCTPGYYNFEGESNRRQDGNYNGGFRQWSVSLNLRGCHSEPERSEGEESRVASVCLRFLVAEFTPSEVEGPFAMTAIKITWTKY